MKQVDVASCCHLALLLELATTPKPGLVDKESRTSEFAYFLASSVALHVYFWRAASDVAGLGGLIEHACDEMLSWQGGGNTHLGAVLLLMPLAAAFPKAGRVGRLRAAVRRVLAALDYRDTLAIFRAVRRVGPGGLGRVAFLDVREERTYEKIWKRKIGVVDALRPYRDFDVVAHEYVTGYKASFNYGYRYLRGQVGRGCDANEAGVNTFLNILGHMPDTHVARRYGVAVARTLSSMARKVLEAGGFSTTEGRKALDEMRLKVLRAGYRPAATADILAASFCILLLDGWRP